MKSRQILLFSVLVFVSLACAAPVLSATPTPRPKLVFPTPVPLSSLTALPGVESAGLETPTPSETGLSIAASPVPTGIVFPWVDFERNTNCRLGPATSYFQVTSFLKDRSAQAEGRNGDSSWLWVRSSSDGQHCWVSISNIKGADPYSYLPVVDFPLLPETPAQLLVERQNCGPKNTIVLVWPNISGETGFHFYRNGIMLATLKANAINYVDNPPNGKEYFYEIESINSYGLSSRMALKVPGCGK